MTGFQAYRIFQALNIHFFTGKYDYFKYNGHLPTASPEAYAKKAGDHFRFDRLGRKFFTQEDLENFIVANLLESEKRVWIGKLVGPEPDEIYKAWQSRTQSIQYNMRSELKRLIEDTGSFNGIFKPKPNEHPPILKAYMGKTLSIETFTALSMLVPFIPRLDVTMVEIGLLPDDAKWRCLRNTSMKYLPFLERLNISVASLKKAYNDAVEDTGVTS